MSQKIAFITKQQCVLEVQDRHPYRASCREDSIAVGARVTQGQNDGRKVG